MVSRLQQEPAAAEAQRDWAGLGARRQLNEPMDLEPGSQEQHAEPRRAAAAAEPHKRRALPAGADRAAIALAENVPLEEVPAGAKLASMALGDGRPLEDVMDAIRCGHEFWCSQCGKKGRWENTSCPPCTRWLDSLPPEGPIGRRVRVH
eukprot:5421546-Prymnesium_polylepis.1